jgi:hypothetical protein
VGSKINLPNVRGISNLSNEWAGERQASSKTQQERILLDSPKGIALLPGIRNFLGMSPNARPLQIYNFVMRNTDLTAHIADNTLPVRSRYRSTAMGKRFQKDIGQDLGLDTILDDADDKWALKTGFVNAWNSLNWIFNDENDDSNEYS